MVEETFPQSQFLIEGFSRLYRLDHNSNGGGILLNAREDIPSDLIAIENETDRQFLCVELNLRNDKWLINCSYNLHKSLIHIFLSI